MIAVPFDPKIHYPPMALWYEAWGMEPPKPCALPKIGFVVENVCAGFLYQTDSSVAIVEGLISDPGANTTERDQGLNLVVDAICRQSKALGFKSVYGFTSHAHVTDRALRLGFKKTDRAYALVAREL